jgi:hypothetical protein
MHLVENKTFWTYPRVSGIILTVMEHFAIQTFISIVTGLFATASEFRLGQELCKTIWFFFIFF